MPTRTDYPDTPREEVVRHLSGRQINDPYHWLEDPEHFRTVRWAAEQETLYRSERAVWSQTADWEAKLAALVAVDRVLTPKVRGSRFFMERWGANKDHPVLHVREGGVERPLLDVHALDPTGRTVLDGWQPSVEGDRLTYQISRDGTEESVLWVLDVVTGLIIDGPIDRVRRTSISWLPGGKAFYYTRLLPSDPHPGEKSYYRRVYLHEIGRDQRCDALVFGEGRPKTQFYSVSVSSDGRWLTITATAGTSTGTDVYLADLSEGSLSEPRLRPIQEGGQARTRLHILPGTQPDGTAWLRTDRDAPRRRVVTCSPAGIEVDAWRTLIAERPDAVLDDFAILNGPQLARPVAVVAWLRHATSVVTIHDLATGREIGTIALPGLGTVGGFSTRPGPDHQVWFSYTDYATPAQVLHYDARTNQLRPWPDTFMGDNRPLKLSLETYQSSDGTAVRMFVVSRTGHPDSPRPTILTGYGGFGVSMSPAFSAKIVAWVEAGGVYATACLRGGGEEGEQWHRAGRAASKQNTFDDFDAAADHLVKAGWTSPGQLGIMGGSNGGLLVGVALTQHPEKYAAAVCMSPLLDMARYESFGLGPSWMPEYGSANDPALLSILLSYSPYHHVSSGTAYPPTLFTVAENDTRVDPLHARKMCAALQYASSGGPVLFRSEQGVGHGSRAVSLAIALQADCLAFLATQLGLSVS